MSGARSAAAVLVEALDAYGVERVFGNPGTTELPLLEAVGDGDLEYVLAHHEDVAVGMAAGYATRLRDRRGTTLRNDCERQGDRTGATAPSGTGDDDRDGPLPLGVVNLHLTAGVAHGLGNLYGAWMAGAPVLVTAGQHSLSFRHEEPILAGDLQRHVEPYTTYAAEVTDPDALPTMLRRAVRAALTPPTGPAFLALPMDVTEAATTATPERLGVIPNAGRGDPAALDRAADLVAESADVVLLVGDGVARAGAEAVEAAVAFAEASGARVHGEALSAAVAYPRAHDQWASVLPPAADAIGERLHADVVVLAGCATNTTLARHDGPLLEDGTFVHLGADASALGKRLPADVAVLGDPGSLLDELADRVRDRVPAATRRERRRSAVDRAPSVRRDVEARGRAAPVAGGDDGPARPSPAALAEALEAVAPDALLVDEGVGAKYALLARWDLEHGDFHSNKGGCLGYGLPAAVGAALAEADAPDPRSVVGFVGDGAYAYYPQTVRAAVRAGVDLAVVVSNNGGYGSVAEQAEQRLEGGADAVPGLTFEGPIDAAANARSHGASGHRVDDRDDLRPVIATAVEAAGVDVVDVRVRD